MLSVADQHDVASDSGGALPRRPRLMAVEPEP